MKTDTVEIVPTSEVRDMLRDLIVTCRGQKPAAEEIGTSQAAVSQCLHGYQPNFKILRRFELETRKFIVRKTDKPTKA